MLSLKPDEYVADVLVVDLDQLRREGVSALIVDLDNTLLPRDTSRIAPAMAAWARALRDRGFKVCLVSNNWHERVREVAAELGLPLVAKAVKPLPFAFLRALRIMGARRSSTVVIGDQYFTDVVGGKLLGMRTVMVAPLSSTDLWHTLMLRRLESLIMGGESPSGDRGGARYR